MFEDEYSEIQKKPLKVEWLMMDSNILLPPTGTPMTGIEFSKRLPCGEVINSSFSMHIDKDSPQDLVNNVSDTCLK